MQDSKQIPKFASFKAKPTQSTEDVKKARRVDDETYRRDERDRRKSKHRNHHHRSHSQNEAETIRDVSPAPPQSQQKTQDIYKIDSKGDIHNVIYGTIHRYSIPQYRRAGRGAVLGLPPRFKIDRAYDGEDFVVIRTKGWIADGARHKSKSLLARAETSEKNVFRVRQMSITDIQDAYENFIPLTHNGSRKRQRISGGYTPTNVSDDEAEKYGYRSIHGKAKPEHDLPSDMEASFESDDNDEGNAVRWDREANQRNSELLRCAEDDPGNVSAWLEVIKYQDILLSGSDSQRQLTKDEKRSLADIKLSLYEKALKKVGKNPEKYRLLLGYLEEGAKIWESKRLSEQWHTILKHNPGYISLWVGYIDFRQTAFLEFTFERCKIIYLECMNLNASSADGAEKEVIHIYLFLRMTLFIREAGFSELAVGLWQAVLELTLFRPKDLIDSPKDDILNAFASFWESEVARIGEPGSKGWNNGKNSDLEPFMADDQTEIRPETLFSSWYAEERRLSRGARLPARVLDIVENDDPYRVVLWSDIEVFLTFFINWQDKNILTEEFLKFCYLPPINPLRTSTKSTMLTRGDAFLRTELIYLPDSSIAKLINPSFESSEQSASTTVFDVAPLQNIVHSSDSLFADSSWFQSMAMWREIIKNEEAIIDVEWVRRCLRLFVGAFSEDDSLAECVLAIEFSISPNEGKKYAKSLLKKRPSSLRLYNAFALMETRLGNLSTASHIWATTFSMAANLSEVQRLEYGALIRSWVWECLTSNKVPQAIKLFTLIPDFTIDLQAMEQQSLGTDMSPTQRLKTEHFLLESSDHSLSVQNLISFTAWAELVVLLQYLINSFDISSALKAFTDICGRLMSSTRIAENYQSIALELLHQSRSRLLYHHITSKRIYKPTEVREILLDSASQFPHNTMLLSLFRWNEAKIRIDERIRNVFNIPSIATRGLDSNQIPITTSLLTIIWELTRPVYSGSTIHSARAAFEHALDSSPFSSSASHPSSSFSAYPSLWKLYIYFELYRAHDPAAAQRVYYRAIRACPWFKDILLLAFDTNLWAIDNSNKYQFDDFWELRRIYNVFVDKELRIHVEIKDEVFDEAEKLWVKNEQERILREESNSKNPYKRRKEAGQEERRGKEVIHLPDDADSEEMER